MAKCKANKANYCLVIHRYSCHWCKTNHNNYFNLNNLLITKTYKVKRLFDTLLPFYLIVLTDWSQDRERSDAATEILSQVHGFETAQMTLWTCVLSFITLCIVAWCTIFKRAKREGVRADLCCRPAACK